MKRVTTILLCAIIIVLLPAAVRAVPVNTLGLSSSPPSAGVYPLQIFTGNGGYSNSPDMNLFVEVVDAGPGKVDFTFRNESLVDSSIARIYFDDISLLGQVTITEGPGTLFIQNAEPANLPAGNTLSPPFETDDGLSFGSNSPPPHEGISPGQWVRLTFDLKNNATFQNVIVGLNTAALRVGVHVIALPDGSSESAVTIPEPATVCLLGLSTLLALVKRTH